MSIPDPVDAGYMHYFVKMSQPDVALEDVATRPENLTIPVSGVLQLAIEHVGASSSAVYTENDI